jgi:hypothetical protein
MTWKLLAGLAQACALALIIGLAFVHPAWPHDWIPEHAKWCCNERDCLPHPRSDLERLLDGWRVKATGQVFQDGASGIYPNFAPHLGEVFICHIENTPRARCIFVLPEGS